jgi:hypothetical protein
MHKVAVLDKIFLLKSLCLCSKICLFRHDICFPELRNLPTYSVITDMLLSGGANGYHWRKIKHIFTESDCCTVRCDAIACVGSFHLLKQWRQQVLQKRWHKYNILITVTPRKLVIHVFPFPWRSNTRQNYAYKSFTELFRRTTAHNETSTTKNMFINFSFMRSLMF